MAAILPLSQEQGLIVEFVLIGGGLAIVYLLPALVAHRRRHRAVAAIAFLTLVAGWTGLGWVIAMTWALAQDNRARG